MNEPANLDAARKRKTAAALDRVKTAREAAEQAGLELRAAIVAAVAADATYSEAGRAAGLTRGRVYQIVHEERRRAAAAGRKKGGKP